VVDKRFDKILAEVDAYDKLIEVADTEDKINLILMVNFYLVFHLHLKKVQEQKEWLLNYMMFLEICD